MKVSAVLFGFIKWKHEIVKPNGVAIFSVYIEAVILSADNDLDDQV